MDDIGFAQGELGVQCVDVFYNVKGFPQSAQRTRGRRGTMCLKTFLNNSILSDCKK